MRIMPGASHAVTGPLVRSPHGNVSGLRLLAVVALTVVVALAVDCRAQARLGEQLLFDLALLAQLDLGLEDVDLSAQSSRMLAVEAFFPGLALRALGRSKGVGRDNLLPFSGATTGGIAFPRPAPALEQHR